MHGHNYVVWIEFTGEIGEDGFCAGLDYIELYRIVQPVLAVLDHRIVNETIPNSTAENIAAWFVSRVHIPQLSAVTVYETDDTWARVEK
jgi:6-pyruvoyltetrahydropterin/6-carboxytetrahydropterin synthase